MDYSQFTNKYLLYVVSSGIPTALVLTFIRLWIYAGFKKWNVCNMNENLVYKYPELNDYINDAFENTHAT